MNLQGILADTRSILETLEAASGYPASCFEDPSLTVLATIKTGTPSSPIHVIRYRPGEAAPDYQIAVEAGYALRTFNQPPERRFHISGDDASRNEVISEVKHLNPQMDVSKAEAVGGHLFDGLLTQLRSCPTGMLVDMWIHANYPGLRALQASSLEAQAHEYTQCLAQELDRAYPQKIVHGNRVMNAAHAFFVSSLLNKPHLAIPYRAAGLEPIATELLSDITKQPLDKIDDQSLIMAWADRLGVASWIKWLPFN